MLLMFSGLPLFQVPCHVHLFRVYAVIIHYQHLSALQVGMQWGIVAGVRNLNPHCNPHSIVGEGFEGNERETKRAKT